MSFQVIFKRWRRDVGGSAAIEFAMVGPLFLALVLGVGEVGWLTAKSMLIEQALNRSIRAVRIGGPGAPTTHDEFRKLICDQTILISDCQQSLLLEMTVVKSASSFPTAAMPCIEREKPAPTTTFNIGGRSEMMFVRACLTVDPILPLIAPGLGLPRNPQGRFNLISTSGFMNEPGV